MKSQYILGFEPPTALKVYWGNRIVKVVYSNNIQTNNTHILYYKNDCVFLLKKNYLTIL